MRNLIGKLEIFLESHGDLEEALAVGQTLVAGNNRIHRFGSSIRVTDLTNAGKRGKMVDEFALYDLDYVDDPSMKKDIAKFASMISGGVTYKKALALAKSVVDIANRVANKSDKFLSTPKIEENKMKGVDVAPADMGKIIIDGQNVTFRADMVDGFSVRDKTDQNEQTMMTPVYGAKKKSIKKAYAWAVANKDFIKKATFQQIRKEFKNNNIDSHYYLAVD